MHVADVKIKINCIGKQQSENVQDMIRSLLDIEKPVTDMMLITPNGSVCWIDVPNGDISVLPTDIVWQTIVPSGAKQLATHIAHINV